MSCLRLWLPAFLRSSRLMAARATLCKDGETGFIAADDGFSDAIAKVILDPELHARMGDAARLYAQSASWDSVFEGVYSTYDEVLASHGR